MQKNRLFLIFSLFAISLHAQEPVQGHRADAATKNEFGCMPFHDATEDSDTDIDVFMGRTPLHCAAEDSDTDFEFHRPMTSLKYLAAASVVELILDAKDASIFLLIENEKVTTSYISQDEPKESQRLCDALSRMDWPEELCRLLSEMLSRYSDYDRISHAIETNDTELLSLALPGIVKKEEFEKRTLPYEDAVSINDFESLVNRAIAYYHAPDKDIPSITALEYLLAHARHTPQASYNRFVGKGFFLAQSADYRLVNLLMYGGVITHNNHQYVIGGGARDAFLNQWKNFPLHRAIVNGSLNEQEPGRRAANIYDYPAGLRKYITAADSCPLGLIETNKVALDTSKRDEWWRAAEHDRCVTANAVLQSGVDVNLESEEGITPLHLASVYGARELLSLLVEHGADVQENCNARMLLHCAAGSGNSDAIAYLVEHKADVNAKIFKYPYGDNSTSLHRAAENGHTGVVAYLVEHEGNVNAKNDGGETPLHYAAEKGYTGVLAYLVEHGGDVNAKNTISETPLHYAAEKGHTGALACLVENGGNVNAQNNVGDTPLHRAAEKGHTGVVAYLVDHGGNVNAQNEDGYTPLFLFACNPGVDRKISKVICSSCALKQGNLAMVDILHAHGAKE